jgi:hypothetical protein
MGGYSSTLKLPRSRVALCGAYSCGRLQFDGTVPHTYSGAVFYVRLSRHIHRNKEQIADICIY